MTTDNGVTVYEEDGTEVVQIDYSIKLTLEDVQNASPLDEQLVPLNLGMHRCFRGIWNENFAPYFTREARSRRPPRTSRSKQLKILLTNLYLAWKSNPDGCVSLPMGPYEYTKHFHIVTSMLIEVVDLAEGLGFITKKPGGKGLGNTCVFPTSRLIEIFERLEDS